MRLNQRNRGFRLSVITGSGALVRVIAGLVMVAFLNLQVGVAGGLLVSSARAQESAKRRLAVKVYPLKASDAGLAKAAYVVLRGGADRLALQGFSRALAITPQAQAAIDKAWQHVNKGRALLKENKIAESFVEFSAAEAAAGPFMGYADRALVAHIYKGLGVGFVAASKPLQAKRAIKISLFAYPEQGKSEYSYSREIENFFLSAQREVLDSPTGTVEVESIPEGAEVYVDFVFRGFSPLAVQDLKVGEHVVTFVADGYEPLAQLVEITGGPGEFAMGEMVELPKSGDIVAAGDELGKVVAGSNAGPKAGAYANQIGATDLLALGFGDAGDSFALKGVYLGGGNVQTVNYTIPKDADVMAEVEGVFGRAMGTMPATTLALGPLEPDMVKVEKVVAEEDFAVTGGGEELLIDPNSPLFKDQTEKKKTSVVDKWWFWTALIVGIGAVGGLTYWGVTSGGDSGGAGGTGGININLGGVR
ncbi:MAG TPA: PEGA domain-containing protein [Myxococcota bacterium]|nr:PEGA domain-containing protein [Myxococcota bacterium]